MKYRYSHFFRTTFFAFILTIVVSGCENDVEEVKNLGKRRPNVEEGVNIESLMSNGGKMKAKLLAPKMLRFMEDTAKVEFPASLHVDFYDSTTTIESQLSAKYGRYLENDNKVFLRDSVVFLSRKGDTLWCNELYWDQYKSIFYTDKPAIISQKQPRQKIYAEKGLIADQNFKWFTLNSVGKRFSGKENFINIPDSSY
jgi:hypothetical protein